MCASTLHFLSGQQFKKFNGLLFYRAVGLCLGLIHSDPNRTIKIVLWKAIKWSQTRDERDFYDGDYTGHDLLRNENMWSEIPPHKMADRLTGTEDIDRHCY